jgi:predicted nucleotidyltransferase
MVRKADSFIRGIVRKLVRRYHPDKIILFGSYANGNPRRDSDIDLFIIKNTRKPGRARRTEVRKLLDTSTEFPPVEPIIMTWSEVRHQLDLSDDFIKTIIGKGRVLYDRAG